MELSFVIVTIAILAGIAAPRYSKAVARYRAEMGARRVAGDLLLAQSRARAQSASQAVVFSGNTYSLTGVSDYEHPTNTYTVDISDEPYKATITLSLRGATTITFDMYGKPSAYGGIIIQCGDAIKTVNLDSDTGATVIQ
jgi:Tfp pilus assembly protein FimT